MRSYPPRFADRNKRAVFAELMRPGEEAKGTITFTRWREGALPAARSGAQPDVLERGGFFVYGEPLPPGTMAWHLNFAMSDCFGAYAGPLLAQDELQVLEHPALASIREAAAGERLSLLCVEEGRPTPVLLSGVERRGRLDTRRGPGRPWGLYGNVFARAHPDAVHAAIERIDPPTLSNILAIEAPAYGSGLYTQEQLEYVLATAATGFRCAVLETRRVAQKSGQKGRTRIHTGFWGAGAYGGNRECMALLQLLAAELAEVEELVFYSVDAAGSATFAEAARLHGELPEDASIRQLVEQVAEMKFAWGVSNGT